MQHVAKAICPERRQVVFALLMSCAHPQYHLGSEVMTLELQLPSHCLSILVTRNLVRGCLWPVFFR